jgi:hypothetical protein
LGCHQNENNLFYTQKANGIFGIQTSRSLLHRLFNDKQHVSSTTFSICLAEWGGLMTVGGYNATHHTSPIQYAGLQGSRYGVSLTSMVVGGKTITDFRSSVIDSGTTYTYMGRAPYRALKGAIESYCSANSKCGATLKGTCWTIPQKYDGLKLFPTVEVRIASISTKWGPEAYMYRKGRGTQWCYAFEDDGPHASTVLGASFMINKDVVFDLVNRRVGFALANCPQYKDRPAHVPPTAAPPTAAPSQAIAATAAPPTAAPSQAIGAHAGSGPSSAPTPKVQETTTLAETLIPTPKPTPKPSGVFGQSLELRSAVIGAAAAVVLLTGILAIRFCFRRCKTPYQKFQDLDAHGSPHECSVPPDLVGDHFEIGIDDGDDDFDAVTGMTTTTPFDRDSQLV